MATCRDPIGLTLQALAALIFSMLLAACSTGNERDRDATAKDERGTSKAGGEGEARSRAIVPRGATIAASGFASILSAPPRPYDNEPPPPVDQTNPEVAAIAQKLGISPREAEAQMNPDRATSLAATELVGRLQADAKGNFITIAIERDPLPYYVFYFRHDAAATLAGFTKNASFHARQQGVSKNELQPIYDEWWQRFEPQKLIGGGAIDEIHGVVHFDMNIDEAGFNKIAKREEWRLPEQLELRFSRVRNPRSVDPALASFVRIFPREDRSPAILNMAAIQGRIVLRDGCFRVSESFLPANALVIFGRDSELTLDSEGYMVVGQPGADHPAPRIGETMRWGGPRGTDATDAGMQQLRSRCGAGPVIAVGEPTSVYASRIRPFAIDSYARIKGISRQKAWDQIKACFAKEDARVARGGPDAARPPRECDSVYPNGPPPPDRSRSRR